MKLRPDLLRKELAKRVQAIQTAPKPFSLADYCFDKQQTFLKDPSKRKTAVCSRRAGKTVSCAADLHDTTEKMEGDVAYITLNRKSAKKIIWRDLLAINKEYGLNGKVDGTELTITKPNGNVIHVSGAKDASEIEKFRGMKFRKVYIDECQSFRPYIQDLIEDVVEPALTDYDGSLILIGTPGPVPAGYFYDVTHNPAWSHHNWTMADNPHIRRLSGRDPIEIIKDIASSRGLQLDSPRILREYFGQWVEDQDSLVYHFNPVTNIELAIPPLKDLTFVFGIDIGWKDSDAIAVLGYSHQTQKVYLVEEYVQSKNDITTLVNKIQELQKTYAPVRMVMDAGALGKKIQEEIRTRHQLPVEAAEKQRKYEFIALMNDDLRMGRLMARPGTRFQEDCNLVQWDYSNPAKPVVADSYHTDIGDAVLYAWRECKHYFYEVAQTQHNKWSDAYMQELEQRESEALQAKKDGSDMSEFTDINSWEDLGISDWEDDF